MPRIPINQYQQRTTSTVGVNLAKANEADYLAPSQALGQVARAVGNMADDALTVRRLDQQQAEEKGAVWANEQAMANRSAWLTKFGQMRDAAPEDGSGFSKNVLDEFDSSTSKLIEQAPTTQAKQRLRYSLQQQRLTLQDEAEQYEREAGVKFKLNGTNRALDSAMISARARPQDFEQLAADHDTAVQAAGFTPQVSATVREKSYRSLAGAAVEGMIQRDPQKTLNELNLETPKSSAVRALDYEQRDQLRRQAESEIREREALAKHHDAEAKQSLADRQRDEISANRMGLEYKDNPLTQADYVAALGQEEGHKAYANLVKERQLGADIRSLALMPPDEQQQLIQSRAPQGAEGDAESAERYRVLTQQANYLNTLREKDPAAYVAQYNPAVQRAFAAAQSSPEAAQQYAVATIAEQKRLGVTQPQVLPESMASAIAQQFYSGNGEDVANLVASEQQRWKQYWPQVFGELAAKKLPPAALAIGRGMEPGAAARLASASATKLTDLKNGVDVPPADVKQKLNEHMSDFMNSLGGVVGAENTFSGMYDAAERLSYLYMRQGKSVSDATDQAYREVLGDHYAFRQINGKTARIPIEQDSPELERGAMNALQLIDSVSLKPPKATPTSNEFQALDDLKRSIKKRGYWVTSGGGVDEGGEGEQGLVLFLDGAPILKSDGKPYWLTWDQLRYTAASTSEVARRSQVEQSGVKGTSGLR